MNSSNSSNIKNIKSVSYVVKKKQTGSWKWIIVTAYGVANLLIIPCLTSFGLIFKDTFKELNFTSVETTLILNLNSALGMTFGLFNGVLLKTFGYRKIAFLGGVLFSTGITSTAFATTFQHFLLTYSVIASIGMGLCSSSFQLALNTYFKDDRNKAFGIGATITGLGPILFPHLISCLLKIYGAQGCILIIGGLTMNIICAALLLKPFQPDDNLNTESNDNDQTKFSSIENGSSLYKPTPSISRKSTIASLSTISDDEIEYLETCPIFHNVDTQSIYGFDVVLHPLTTSDEILWKDLDYKFEPRIIIRSSSEHQIRQRPLSAEFINENEAIELQPTRRWFESGSVASVNLGSSMKIFHEEEKMHNFRRSQSRMRIFDEKGFFGRRASLMKMNFMQRRATVATIPENDLPKIEEERPLASKSIDLEPQVSKNVVQRRTKKKTSICDHIRQGWKRFVKVFDLGLLNDKIYLNIMIGISIAIFAEINFSLLTPFILSEYNYTTEQIATFMSLLATVDIFCRFVSPFIGDYFKQPARIMYMYALFMLIIMRTSLICVDSYHGILWVAIGMGIAKGVRQVYMSCIIPSYIPLDRLAAASGIQMVANGIILLSMGSSIGALRDLFGSYGIVIIFINIVTLTTLALWTAELIYMKRRNAKISKEIEQNQLPELCKYNIEVN